MNYKAVSVSQLEWHRESNIFVGFNIDRLNYLSVKTDFKWEIHVLLNLFLVLLGSNFTDLVWLKGSWFHIFTNKRWVVFTNFGGFSKIVLIIKPFSYQEICWYSIYKLIFYKCLMQTWLFVLWKTCRTTWFYLNLYVWIYLYIFENYERIIFVSILNMFWKPMASCD